jgi:hypothetical protein
MNANAGVDGISIDFLIEVFSEVLGSIPETIHESEMPQPVASFAQHVLDGQADRRHSECSYGSASLRLRNTQSASVRQNHFYRQIVALLKVAMIRSRVESKNTDSHWNFNADLAGLMGGLPTCFNWILPAGNALSVASEFQLLFFWSTLRQLHHP